MYPHYFHTSYQSFSLRFLYSFLQSLQFKCQSNLILKFQILSCSTLMNVFPSYLMLRNIFGWKSIVKHPGIIRDLSFFLPDAEKSPPEDRGK